MKVLLFTSIYPSRVEPTRGPYNHNVFTALANRCEVRVVSPQPFWSRLRRPNELLKIPHENQTNLETLLPTYWSIPKIACLHGRAMYHSVKPCITELHRKFPFDVVFSVWAYPDAVAASLLARDFDCPLVIKTMGSDINVVPELRGVRSQIMSAFRQANRVVSVSDALRVKTLEMGLAPEKSLVQHNGVNGEKFRISDPSIARKELGISLDRRILCYVGRLGQEKGVDILVEAMKKQEFPNTELHLIGDGDQGDRLKARVGELGLGGSIIFHGMRLHHEIPLWLSACDIFCLPSRNEGCPNVVLEALASGRPVVATRVGGVPELVNKGNGVLVPAEDSDAFAKGIDEALNRTWDPEKLRASVEFLSWDEVGEMYYQVLVGARQEYQK